jgi:hypothetical protein
LSSECPCARVHLTQDESKAPNLVRRLYDEDEEIEACSDEGIPDGLVIGDNVAVRTPSEEEPFWIMLVVKATYIIAEAFCDPDGNAYLPRDVVFNGMWYEQLREGSLTYLLKNDRDPSTIYSHLILSSKFSMSPIVHPIKSHFSGFELHAEVKEIINEALRSAALLD